MLIAIANLRRDSRRMLVAVFGISFATILMTFQGSLFVGFLMAASRIVDAAGGDIWLVPKGVPSVEFPVTTAYRYADLAKVIPGVAGVNRLCFGFVTYRRPNGSHEALSLVGFDGPRSRDWPSPRLLGATRPEALAVDRSIAGAWGLREATEQGEIFGRRVTVASVTDGFSTFLGAPLALMDYRDASRHLQLSSDQTHFLLIGLRPGFEGEAIRQQLSRRLPEFEVLTREAFAHRARIYWMTQTGAGGAIVSAAVLGMIIGLLMTSQTVYAATMERIEEYATLKAIGASNLYLARIVIVQALVVGIAGSLLGLSVTPWIVAEVGRALIPWAISPWWLPFCVVVPTLAISALASVASVRIVLRVDPATVFRP